MFLLVGKKRPLPWVHFTPRFDAVGGIVPGGDVQWFGGCINCGGHVEGELVRCDDCADAARQIVNGGGPCDLTLAKPPSYPSGGVEFDADGFPVIDIPPTRYDKCRETAEVARQLGRKLRGLAREFTSQLPPDVLSVMVNSRLVKGRIAAGDALVGLHEDIAALGEAYIARNWGKGKDTDLKPLGIRGEN